MTTTGTTNSTTPATAPKSGPADTAGIEEESTYSGEAEALASNIFDALDSDNEVGGVELPGESGDPLLSQDGSSPADTQDTPTPVEEGKPQTVTEAQAVVAPAEQEQQIPPAQTQQVPAVPSVEAPAAAPNAQAQTSPVTGTPAEGVDLINQVRSEIDKSRDVFTQALSQHYSMTEEEASEVLTEPEKALPKLAARVHLEVVQNVLGTIAQTMPAVVTGILAAQREHTTLVDSFFSKWPTLDRNADIGAVMELGRLYRTQNPQASSDDFIKNVGAMAVVRLGKVPAGNAQQQAPVVAPTNAPYQPAARSSSLQPPAAPQNEWAAMAELLDE